MSTERWLLILAAVAVAAWWLSKQHSAVAATNASGSTTVNYPGGSVTIPDWTHALKL
jgi:hypothetical protein